MASTIETTTKSNEDISWWLNDLQRVQHFVAPAWPLRDLVAVNPFHDVADLSFQQVRDRLAMVKSGDLLPPLHYFQERFDQGEFSIHHVEKAFQECSGGENQTVQWQDVSYALMDDSAQQASGSALKVRTIAASATSEDWSAIVIDEISRFCSAYFDQGMSSWNMTSDAESLYATWRETAQVDRRPELLGLNDFRRFVAALPDNATDAITHLAESLGIPPAQRFNYLLAQLMSIPGWAAYTKYSDRMAGSDNSLTSELLGLLAIRMAYDCAIAQSLGLEDEQVLSEIFAQSDASESAKARELTHIRYILQTAVEIKYREQLVEGLSKTLSEVQNPKTAECQMVFCIDVRSEPFRRHVESQAQAIETFGFAGFFGIAAEVTSHEHSVGTPQCPVLLTPSVKAHVQHADPEMAQAKADRGKALKAAWKKFRSAAMSGFSFVESCGLGYIVKLTREALKLEAREHHCTHSHVTVTEDVHGNQIDLPAKVEMAASILKNLGLTENLARIVVFCGHGSETRNNPLAASLDCGACG
ncbi:MAG TPA: hypothetical protein DDW52_25800, partial [Planctomycetaceae bacterium]|nr:hypothetical protein [Planctomycetaceae bacterium]